MSSTSPETTDTPQLCYYDEGKLGSEVFIPCWGTTMEENYPCCKAGDMCLENSACYSGDFGVTYQYGCTDSTYKDSSCPKKCNLDTERSNWVGLVFCNGTNNTPDDTWVCNHPDNSKPGSNFDLRSWDPELSMLPETACSDIEHEGQYVAFEDSSDISRVIQLPPESKLPTYFSENSARTATPSSSAATATAASNPTSTDNPGPTNTSDENTSNKESETRTVALAAGLGVGIPAALAAIGIFCYFFLRQRRRRANKPPNPEQTTYSAVDGANGGNAGPVYSFKAELPAEEKPSQGGLSPAMTELDGTPNPSHYVSPMSDTSEFGTQKYAQQKQEGVQTSPSELPG